MPFSDLAVASTVSIPHQNLNTYLVVTEIAVGDEVEIAATQLGAPANKFLIFVNKDTAQQAEVEIVMI